MAETMTENRLGGRGKCRHCGKMENNVSYHEAHDCPENKMPWVTGPDGKPLLGAPPWLVKRMEAVRKRQSPTLEEVRQTFEASANWEFDCVKQIRESDYIR